MNTALMPYPRLQFSDLNGVPLAGGFVYTYAAGTTTPQATYQDSLGATPNTNPIVLDATGSAAIWLAALAYKIQLSDFNGVSQWTVDNVTAVSLTQLNGVASFATLAITGNETVGGNLTVNGTTTTATLDATGSANIAGNVGGASLGISGAADVGGAFSAASSAIAGAETIGGTLTVSGAAALATLSVGGTDIDALILSLIPTLTAVSGALIITDISQIGNWLVVTFGATTGTRIRLAFGSGFGLASGAVIPLPTSGFSSSQLIALASISADAATAGNQISMFACSVSAGVITVTSSDTEGHNFTPTAGWFGVAWQTGF